VTVSYFERSDKPGGEQIPVYAISFELYGERHLARADARLQQLLDQRELKSWRSRTQSLSVGPLWRLLLRPLLRRGHEKQCCYSDG